LKSNDFLKYVFNFKPFNYGIGIAYSDYILNIFPPIVINVKRSPQVDICLQWLYIYLCVLQKYPRWELSIAVVGEIH
jgi:hypothetical protein